NTITVGGEDDEGSSANGGDSATVTGGSSEPSILVAKLVDANGDQVFHDSESIPDGAPTSVTYKFTITNRSGASDPVTITSIVDDQIGNDAALLAAAIAANGGSAVLAPRPSFTFPHQSRKPVPPHG